MIYIASLFETKYIYSIPSIILAVEQQSNFSIYTFHHMCQLL